MYFKNTFTTVQFIGYTWTISKVTYFFLSLRLYTITPSVWRRRVVAGSWTYLYSFATIFFPRACSPCTPLAVPTVHCEVVSKFSVGCLYRIVKQASSFFNPTREYQVKVRFEDNKEIHQYALLMDIKLIYVVGTFINCYDRNYWSVLRHSVKTSPLDQWRSEINNVWSNNVSLFNTFWTLSSII